MKLISLNTFKGRKQTEIITYLKQENPDFIALQEILSIPYAGETPITTEKETLNFLEILKYNFKTYETYYSPSLKTKINGYEIYYGNAFFSKIPLHNKETTFIYETYSDNFVFPPEGVPFENEPRCMQRVELLLNDIKMVIINLHGLYQLNNYKGDSEKAMSMINNILVKYNKSEPTIICGDFNLSPDTQAIQGMSNNLVNLTVKSVVSTTKTSLATHFPIIDYIFVNKLITVNNFEINSDVVISDHKPLILDFNI